MSSGGATGDEHDWSLAEIVILSTTRSADHLAEAVGLPPDRAWNRGHPKKTRGLVEKFSGITYTSRVPRTARPEEHLTDLLARLEPIGGRIAALATRLGEQDGRPDPVRVWVTHLTSNASPGYDFSPRQVTQVGAMGAWLGVSVDVYDPPEDEGAAEVGPAETRDLAGVGGAAAQSTGSVG